MAVSTTVLAAPVAGGNAPLMVRDINGSGSSDPTELTSVGEMLFFAAKGGGKGRELWVSDGTTTGTRRVKDIRPGSVGSYPNGLTVFNGRLYFAADDGVSGEELWTSDGTNAGTQRVRDINPGAASSGPNALTVVKDRLFLFAGTSAGRLELWRTNGTQAGTTRVKRFDDGLILRAFPVAFAGRLYFGLDQCGGDVCGSAGLWRSNGSASGTTQFHFVDNGIYPEQIVKTSNRLYWSDSAGLMTSTGTSSSNTRLVGQEPFQLTAIDHRLFFVTIEEHQTTLWHTAGLAANTEPLQEFHPDYPLNNLTHVSGRLYFSGNLLGLTPNQLWFANDFSAGGPDAVQGCCPDHANPGEITDVSGFVLFVALDRFSCAEDDPCPDQELWISDGTDESTFRVADIRPGASSEPRWLTAHNGRLFFVANDGVHGRELWSYGV